MEAEEELLNKIIERLPKLRNHINTSFIESLINRLSKTKDPEMQKFLVLDIFKEYEKIELNFPNLDDNYPNINFNEGIEIGDLVYKDQVIGRFSLSFEDLNRNTLIIGSTGHGKTSLILNILHNLEKTKVNYFVFDMKKDYEVLGLSDNSVYISSKTLKINPLEPPLNMSYKEWAVHFADIFSDSFALLIGSRDYLLENLVDFFSKWEKDFPPSLSDLSKYLEDYGRRTDYFKVIRGRLRSLSISLEVFDCNNGISFEKLAGKNIIISMEDFGTAESHFIVSFILSYFYYSAIKRKKNNALSTLFVIDDAHSILDANQERDYAKGIPVLHSIISKIREFGFGFIFSDQQISSIISSAIQNTNTKFIGKVNLLQDLPKVLPAEYNLASEIGKLNKGEFIVLTESVNPFCLLRTDKLSLNNNIDEAFLNLKAELDKGLLVYFKEDKKETIDFVLLKEIGENPFLNLTGHYSNLSTIMSREEFNSIKNRLIKEGILSEIQLSMWDQKIHKFLFISKDKTDELGLRDLNSFDVDSFFKLLIKNFVIKHLKAKNINYQVEESGFLIRGLVKVYIFIEQNIQNLLKILETSFDKVVFIVKDSLTKEDILSELIKQSNAASIINIKSLNIMHFSDFKDMF